MKKLDINKLRPEVEIFGKKYRLPTFMSKIVESPDQGITIREIVDEAYPGIKKPESDMLFIHLLKDSRFKDGKPVIGDTNEVEVQGVKYTVSLDDIIKVQKSEVMYSGIKFVFKYPSALEYYTSGCGNQGQVARKFFDYAEFEGVKYNLEEIGGDIPMAVAENSQELMGDIRLNLKDGNYVTGYEKISELLLTKKI